MLQVFTDHSGAAQLANPLLPPRGDIVDRNGVALARTIDAWSIGVHPDRIIGDRRELAQRLNALMPERSVADYRALLSRRTQFPLSLAPRAARAGRGGERDRASRPSSSTASPSGSIRRPRWPATCSAGPTCEGHGVTGMERVLDERLLDAGRRGAPVALSIDSRVQAVARNPSSPARSPRWSAEGGTGIVLDVQTGEVIAHGLGADLQPQCRRPRRPERALQPRDDGRLRARLDLQADHRSRRRWRPASITSMHQRWDATAPIAGRPLQDPRRSQPRCGRCSTMPELIVHSSNIATAHIADAMGARADAGRVPRAGLRRARRISSCASAAAPLWPRDWGAGDGDDLGLRPRHRDHAAAPRQRLCRAGQRRHLAAGDPAAGRAGPPGFGAAGSSPRRPATGSASCCA